MIPGFCCSAASAHDGEQMLGTAPAGSAFLFFEYAGAWGREAVAEAQLPERLRTALAAVPEVNAHVIRHHGRSTQVGVQVIAVTAGHEEVSVEGRVLGSLDEVAALDLEGLAAGRGLGLEPVSDPLWLVCTNGKRDRCCAEFGRPVAKALHARWPAGTWEVNHLGGHRFAATLLSLPSGLVLGRLTPDNAVEACESVLSGDPPHAFLRGRIGLSGPAQFAQATVARQAGVRLSGVRVVDLRVEGDRSLVMLDVVGDARQVEVVSERAEPRQQSCAAGPSKAGTSYRRTGSVPH